MRGQCRCARAVAQCRKAKLHTRSTAHNTTCNGAAPEDAILHENHSAADAPMSIPLAVGDRTDPMKYDCLSPHRLERNVGCRRTHSCVEIHCTPMTLVQGKHRHTVATIQSERLGRRNAAARCGMCRPHSAYHSALCCRSHYRRNCSAAQHHALPTTHSRTSQSTRVTAPNSGCVRRERWVMINGGAQRVRELHMRRTSLTAGCIHSNCSAAYRCDHTVLMMQCVDAKPNSSVDTQSGETPIR